ncbi:MAG: cell envelope biogenesis protein OmpA [Myxococcales bacterium]|jgi:outer membrane protein OmpA-like peptidoglycan-associated protein|nr:cell envelope biogenesis protein OmpA [Myxococcales bacterium]
MMRWLLAAFFAAQYSTHHGSLEIAVERRYPNAMMRSVSFIIFCLIFAAEATAGPGVYVDLNPVVPLGKKPSVNVVTKERVRTLRLHVVRSDGKVIKKRSGKLIRNKRVRFYLDQPEGTFSYEGNLYVQFKSSETEQAMPLKFEATVQGPLKIKVESEDIDLENRRLQLQVSRACVKMIWSVYGDDGDLLGQSEENYDPPRPANQRFTLDWYGKEGVALKIELKAVDTQGFFKSIALFPWKIDIPHEEVVFKSGSHRIEKDQRPKLDDALKKLKLIVKRYRRFAPVKLWVAGHTDTVGDAASNRALSRRRARAIASYFARKGRLNLPIRVTGYGEERLLLETEDEVDEARNRRAEYILSVEQPMGGNWSR